MAFDLAVLFRELLPYLGVLSAAICNLIFNSEVNTRGHRLYVLVLPLASEF